MAEVEADQLKEAVENTHGGTATLVQSVPVRETFEGKTVWEGLVHVFDLAGHLKERPAPTPGHHRSRAAPRDGSSPRCIASCLTRR